jgi:hypothetical protein
MDEFYNPEEGGEEAGVIDSDYSVLLKYGALENSTGESSKMSRILLALNILKRLYVAFAGTWTFFA